MHGKSDKFSILVPFLVKRYYEVIINWFLRKLLIFKLN